MYVLITLLVNVVLAKFAQVAGEHKHTENARNMKKCELSVEKTDI